MVAALAERKLLADIVEGTNAFVQVVDPNFRWLAINGASAQEFHRIFGIMPKVGDNMLELLKDQPEHRDAIRAVWSKALAGAEFVEIGEFGDPGRTRRSYEMRFNCLRNGDGQLIGAYQFVYDVTERLREQERLRQAEEALRQSQKMEAVGQLTGGIAHDFNNLLTGITGSLELLQTRLGQGRVKEIDRYVNAAQGAARRAAALTHRLLAFSRRQTLDPRPTDLNRLVMGMEELIRRTVGPEIALEVVTAGGLWATFIDASQLENALLNLCINGRDAMPEGGRITIETANRWLDEHGAGERDLEPGQYVSLCVTDTGTGMAADVIERAFDPFFTTKPMGQGTGLGLSMVYGFVRQSGGQVRIYSEVGQGTTMCLYLPRHYGKEADKPSALATKSTVRPQASHTILIVDDEPSIRMLLTDALEEIGFNVIEAHDGPTRPEHPAIGRDHRPAHHRCRPARRHERPPARGCRARDPAGTQGAVHHRLCGECDHRQRPACAGHAGADQALRGRGAGRPRARYDQGRNRIRADAPVPASQLWCGPRMIFMASSMWRHSFASSASPRPSQAWACSAAFAIAAKPCRSSICRATV